MAWTGHIYPQFQQKTFTKNVNLSTDSLKVLLLASYTFANTHATMTDVFGAGTEASGTGYTAGGSALTSVSLATSGLVTTLSAANVTWSGSSVAAAYGVVYDAQGGTNATNFPICYLDFGGTQISSSGNFTLTWNASGICTWTDS